jgi:DNA processing protein
MTNLSEEDFYLIALNTVEGIGAIRANLLLDKFTNSKQVFEANRSQISSGTRSIPDKVLNQILTKSTLISAEKEVEFCLKNQIDIISIHNQQYPSRLRFMEDRPLVLYKKGNIHPKIKKTIAIVGTRKSTDYGHRFLDNFFQELTEIKDIAVISGLAYGIDYKAHQLSIDHNIPTIAVMGLALDKIYPAAHTNLAKNILKHDGGWLTETSTHDIATQGVFPRRNRIIAGLSDALLIVETDMKGGAVITAHLANDYNREVFALPGRLNDPQSRGCNNLIKNNLAQIVNSPYDIIEQMGWEEKTNKKISLAIELDFEGPTSQKKCLELIRMNPKIELERLMLETKYSHSELVESLLELELGGLIVALPGNKYELI